MGRRAFYAVLLFVIFAKTSFVLSNGTNISVNRRFNDSDVSVLNSCIDISVQDCKTQCDRRPECVAIDYIFRAKYCRLHAHVGEDVESPGCRIITGFNENESCGDQTCIVNETCDASTTSCIVNECGYPGQKENLQGNVFSFGSKVKYSCARQEETFTCMDDGTWKNVNLLLINEGNGAKSGITCRDIRLANDNIRSGVYRNGLGMNIYCDFDTDGGDWIVFQRRSVEYALVDFKRTWIEYKGGFGDMCGEFWLGLEHMHKIFVTKGTEFELRINMLEWPVLTSYAIYDTFTIGPESEGYTLHVGVYSGTSGDALNDKTQHYGETQNGQMFSTWDNLINASVFLNCMQSFFSGWWYTSQSSCFTTNLNAMYSWYRGIWRVKNVGHRDLLKVSMKFREK